MPKPTLTHRRTRGARQASTRGRMPTSHSRMSRAISDGSARDPPASGTAGPATRGRGGRTPGGRRRRSGDVQRLARAGASSATVQLKKTIAGRA
jgi:hypothetical protein